MNFHFLFYFSFYFIFFNSNPNEVRPSKYKKKINNISIEINPHRHHKILSVHYGICLRNKNKFSLNKTAEKRKNHFYFYFIFRARVLEMGVIWEMSFRVYENYKRKREMFEDDEIYNRVDILLY